jgi:predicted nucleic acid-binding Zn ribbon protein
MTAPGGGSGGTGGRRGRGRGGDAGKSHHPERISDALSAFLKESGLDERVVQAAVVPEWTELVGREIAEVTEPLFVTADQTLFVGVRTNPWMAELQLMEPQILAALNADPARPRVRRLRFQLLR